MLGTVFHECQKIAKVIKVSLVKIGHQRLHEMLF